MSVADNIHFPDAQSEKVAERFFAPIRRLEESMDQAIADVRGALDYVDDLKGEISIMKDEVFKASDDMVREVRQAYHKISYLEGIVQQLPEMQLKLKDNADVIQNQRDHLSDINECLSRLIIDEKGDEACLVRHQSKLNQLDEATEINTKAVGALTHEVRQVVRDVHLVAERIEEKRRLIDEVAGAVQLKMDQHQARVDQKIKDVMTMCELKINAVKAEMHESVDVLKKQLSQMEVDQLCQKDKLIENRDNAQRALDLVLSCMKKLDRVNSQIEPLQADVTALKLEVR